MGSQGWLRGREVGGALDLFAAGGVWGVTVGVGVGLLRDGLSGG